MNSQMFQFVSKKIQETNFQQTWIEEHQDYFNNNFEKELITYLSLSSKGKRLGKNHFVVEQFLQTIQNSLFLPSDIVSNIFITFIEVQDNLKNVRPIYFNNNFDMLDFVKKSIIFFHKNHPIVFINLLHILSELTFFNYDEKCLESSIQAKDVLKTFTKYDDQRNQEYLDVSDLKIDYFINNFSYKYILNPEYILSVNDKKKYFLLLKKTERQLFVYKRFFLLKHLNFVKKESRLYWTNFNLFLNNLRIFLLQHISIENIELCPYCSTIFYINFSKRKFCSRRCATIVASYNYIQRNNKKEDTLI